VRVILMIGFRIVTRLTLTFLSYNLLSETGHSK
jgi:hypothetical protein